MFGMIDDVPIEEILYSRATKITKAYRATKSDHSDVFRGEAHHRFNVMATALEQADLHGFFSAMNELRSFGDKRIRLYWYSFVDNVWPIVLHDGSVGEIAKEMIRSLHALKKPPKELEPTVDEDLENELAAFRAELK